MSALLTNSPTQAGIALKKVEALLRSRVRAAVKPNLYDGRSKLIVSRGRISFLWGRMLFILPE